MKQLLLCSIVAAFTCVSALAGDDKAKACPATAKAAACETACAAAAAKAKAATCETACCAKKLTKKADSTAKGASQLLAKR